MLQRSSVSKLTAGQPAGNNNGILSSNWSPLSPQHNECLPLFCTSVTANQVNYSSSRETDMGLGVSGVLQSNYSQNNQWKTDGRTYRHFRTRNGVILLNGNFWPPLKNFIICFRDLYKIFRNLTETGILPNYTQINGYPPSSVKCPQWIQAKYIKIFCYFGFAQDWFSLVFRFWCW